MILSVVVVAAEATTRCPHKCGREERCCHTQCISARSHCNGDQANNTWVPHAGDEDEVSTGSGGQEGIAVAATKMSSVHNCLNKGQSLGNSGSIEVEGPNGGHYQLIMQDDGNLCVYYLDSSNGRHIKWSSGTNRGSGSGPFHLEVQASDGNVVVYGNSRVGALWSTGTRSNNPSFCIQSDSNLVVYDGEQTAEHAVWASGIHEQASALHEAAASETTMAHDCHWHHQGCPAGYRCSRVGGGFRCVPVSTGSGGQEEVV